MIALGSPQGVKVSSDTEELLKQITSSITEFNNLRPLDADTERRIKLAFLPDRVTASLNMEGIVATRRQTLAVLDAMTISENASKTEQEILNALEADELTFETSQSERRLSEGFIREINGLIERNIGEAPGVYRLRELKISQAAFTPPGPYDVPGLMSELVRIYNDAGQDNAVISAVWLHNRFTHIHPFLDGNGRTGRLLQDYCLLSGGLFPTGIPSAKRDDYYDALAAADSDDWDPLIQIVAIRELDVLAKASAVAKERRERRVWIRAIAQRASDKKSGALYKQYLVWSHKMTELRASFEQAATEFNELSDVIQIKHERFDIIDFAGWKEVSERGYGNQTWFFAQTYEIDNERLFKYIFYFRRHRPSAADRFTPSQNIVSVYVTGGRYNEKYDFRGGFVDTEVRLREVLFNHEDTFWYSGSGELESHSRFGAYEATECLDTDDINLVVQSFIEDILVKKIGI